MRCEGVNWIQIPQDMDQWQAIWTRYKPSGFVIWCLLKYKDNFTFFFFFYYVFCPCMLHVPPLSSSSISFLDQLSYYWFLMKDLAPWIYFLVSSTSVLCGPLKNMEKESQNL
jgi:hypothetical protein